MNQNGHIPVYFLGHVLLISTMSIALTFGEDFPSLVFLVVRTVYKMKELSHFQGPCLSTGPAVSGMNAKL